MGTYTEIHFASKLKNDTPEDVLTVIDYLVNGDLNIPLAYKYIPNHPFFNCQRWDIICRCGSAYFDYLPNAKLITDDYYRTLSFTSNLKNYNDEIHLFLDWIWPYLDKQDDNFIGYYRYEEDYDPKLIYYQSAITSKYFFKKVSNEKISFHSSF